MKIILLYIPLLFYKTFSLVWIYVNMIQHNLTELFDCSQFLSYCP